MGKRTPRIPGPATSYDERTRLRALELYKRHASREIAKLYSMFEDFEKEVPPVPERMIADVLDEYLGDPSLVGFGIGYIKAVIMGKYKTWRAEVNAAAVPNTKERSIV